LISPFRCDEQGHIKNELLTALKEEQSKQVLKKVSAPHGR
jgi:hypothetical protein